MHGNAQPTFSVHSMFSSLGSERTAGHSPRHGARYVDLGGLANYCFPLQFKSGLTIVSNTF